MKKHKRPNLSLNHSTALRLSLIIGFQLAVFMFIGLTFSEKSDYFSDVFIFNAVVHFVTTLFVLFLLYEFCFWAFRREWKSSSKRHFVALLGVIGITILVSPVLSRMAALVFRPVGDELLFGRLIVLNIMKDLVLSFIVYLSTLSVVMVIHNQQLLLEHQQLAAENMRNRYEALKNQLNPHFLFNTLNTLDGLIGYDDEKAHRYLHNLSSSFRYTIQNKEITTLKEELDVVEAYAYLMKIRYGDNLRIQYAVDEQYHNYYIMPVSLQLLIENAVKHNVINDRHPLAIRIETTADDSIKVSNAIQPKIDADAGERVGLANLVERYSLLFGKEVMITRSDVFGVEIPLIAQISDHLKIEI